MPAYTSEQVLALAPDAASAKAGQGLATARTWPSLGANDAAVWGECRGSGKNPYRTQVDLSEPAFKCSCPSRKFPCKHALGLLLLQASQPELFGESQSPDWVREWLDNRAQRVVKQDVSPTQSTPDPKTQARRAAQREQKVTAGIADLELWLRDLVRQGLGTAQEQPYQFWENMAARMVDAQAPGLARLVRQMAGVPTAGDGWQELQLEKLAKLHLLLEGYKRRDELPAPVQADIRALIGWTQNQDELLAQAGQREKWRVLGRRVETEERLSVQRTWLQNEVGEHYALLLSFAAPGQNLDVGLLPDTCLEAELIFFPGNYPLRALLKNQQAASVSSRHPHGYETMAAALQAYARALASNPWLEAFPMVLCDVQPYFQNESDRPLWAVRDKQNQVLPLPPKFGDAWGLLAQGGGAPLVIFGEWNGRDFWPLHSWPVESNT